MAGDKYCISCGERLTRFGDIFSVHFYCKNASCGRYGLVTALVLDEEEKK